ncbi:hypothetical protein [Streptomyces sp. NPDC055287]
MTWVLSAGAGGRAAVALLAALALGGCGGSDGRRSCTLIAGVPGITVIFQPAGGAAVDQVGSAVFRLCVDGKCEERTEASTVAGTRMHLPTADDVRGEELDVRFSVTSAEGGRVIMKDSTKVRMTASWPNGKECDGKGTWSASLTAAPDTGLVVGHRRTGPVVPTGRGTSSPTGV